MVLKLDLSKKTYRVGRPLVEVRNFDIDNGALPVCPRGRYLSGGLVLSSYTVLVVWKMVLVFFVLVCAQMISLNG